MSNPIEAKVIATGTFKGILRSVDNYVPMKRDKEGTCTQLAICEVEVDVDGEILKGKAAPTDDSMPAPGQIWQFTIHEQNNPAGHPRMSRQS